jgi:hypothetical protein
LPALLDGDCFLHLDPDTLVGTMDGRVSLQLLQKSSTKRMNVIDNMPRDHPLCLIKRGHIVFFASLFDKAPKLLVSNEVVRSRPSTHEDVVVID